MGYYNMQEEKQDTEQTTDVNANLAGGLRAKLNRKFKHWEIIAFYLLIYDVLAINFSYFLGLWLRFDLRFSLIPKEYLYSFLKFAPVYTLFTVVVFYFLKLYNSLWRFASFSELNRIIVSSAITTVFTFLELRFL